MGSPSKTANCAPFGRKGGAGPNLTWGGREKHSEDRRAALLKVQ